tara:strand:+ start:1093 stop:1653 length:561 start_codon:yes stop_codon:yes gene_type:complete
MKDFPIIRIDDFYKFGRGERKRVCNSVIKQIKRADWDNNYKLNESKFTKSLYEKFLNTSKELLDKFTLNKNYNKSSCWAVASNKDFIPSVNWHNHILTSTINSVYYLHIPEKMKGGEIEFKSRRKDILKITPKTNELYIFPGWLWHNPINVESEELRLSINMEICTLEQPRDIFKPLEIYDKSAII